MAPASLRQLGLLLYKNYLLRRRHYWVTFLEVAIPIAFAALLLLIRSAVNVLGIEPNSTWPVFQPLHFPGSLTSQSRFGWSIAYAPNSKLANDVIKELLNASHPNIMRAEGFPSEDAMLQKMTNVTSDQYLGGIVLSSLLNAPVALPDNFRYTLRLSASPRGSNASRFGVEADWQTARDYPRFQRLGPREKNDPFGGAPGYYRAGFLYLQSQVDAAVLKMSGASIFYNLSLQRMPYPSYDNDPFQMVVVNQLSVFVMLAFIFMAINVAKNVVMEKEKALKETMKMMGLRSWLHWTAWYINYFLLAIVSVCLFVIFFYIRTSKGSILEHSDPSLVIVFLLFYINSLIFSCFAISTFFNTARAAATASSIIYILSYFPYSFMQNRMDDVPVWLKAFSCILPNMGMALGANVVGRWENSGLGMQWQDIARGPYPRDEFTMLHVLVVMLFSSIFFMIIAWYKENFRPGTYGYPLPWYFPFTRYYWCGQKAVEVEEYFEAESSTNPDIEPDPVNLQCSIAISKLNKVFGSGRKRKVAVGGLNLRIYQGQITALLGHNGAGKTTTMGMITGFIPPTSGDVVVNGVSIRKSISDVRQQLGLCPQHNVLFDELTVWEHLWFFAKLKNFPNEQLDAEIERMIIATHLEPKRDWQASTLSGGMKRKLCVAIAMIGGSKVVILDEPSSGMDPSARRELWTFLQAERTGRTILLTTHFMDEADALGDRIAIMASGKLQCAGSSLFLKARFGAGYHLTLVKAAQCEESAVTNLVRGLVPAARIDSNFGDELSFVLPLESAPSFEALFSRLEQDRESLGIASFGASVTTMEEVFLKVGSLSEKEEKEEESAVDEASMRGVNEPFFDTYARSNDTIVFEQPPNKGYRLFLQQFRGIYMKRFLVTRRSFILCAVQLIIPVVFLIIGLLVLKTAPGSAPDKALELSLKNFGRQVISYGRPSTPYPSATTEQVLLAFSSQFDDRPLTTFANFTDFISNSRSEALGWLLDKGQTDLTDFSQRYVVGAFAENDDIPVAFFNNEAIHSPAIALNAMSNAILRAFGRSNRSLTVTNHPLPKTQTQSVVQSNISALPAAVNLVFGLSILSASFCIFVVRERVTKAKHLHFVAGTYQSAYWLATLAWDFVTFLLPCVCLLIVFLAFQEKAFCATIGRLLGLLLLLLLYGWAALPQMYLFSYLYSVPTSAFQWQSFFNTVTSIAALTVVFIFETIESDLKDAADIMRHVFLFVFPGFGVGRGITDYYSNYVTTDLCLKIAPFCPLIRNNSCCRGTCNPVCVDWTEQYLSLEAGGIGLELIALAVQGVVYLSICLLIETNVFTQFLSFFRASRHFSSPSTSFRRVHSYDADGWLPEDSDVIEQRREVAKPETPYSKLLVLRELSRYFGSHRAVHNLSCAIASGECFGLLGVNGAGKTTTFKMLTGDLSISDGDIFVNGVSVTQQVRNVQRMLGYCPQFDALLDTLTARETLTLFARLRGHPERLISVEVNQLLRAFLLQPYADRLVGTYSGGNKRKLSAATAMVGGPPVLCLDEPTTGMDAVARRHVWRALSDYRMKGNTLVLTSHSMEECEALCTKIAIMVNGQFKCFGACQHLKNKFGRGYTLLAQVPFGDHEGGDLWVRKLKEFVEQSFPSSELKDIHQGILHYQLHPTEGLTWSKVFGTMERNKEELRLENYSVSQTTLEQIFIQFARSQLEPEETKSGCLNCC